MSRWILIPGGCLCWRCNEAIEPGAPVRLTTTHDHPICAACALAVVGETPPTQVGPPQPLPRLRVPASWSRFAPPVDRPRGGGDD